MGNLHTLKQKCTAIFSEEKLKSKLRSQWENGYSLKLIEIKMSMQQEQLKILQHVPFPAPPPILL